MYGGEEHTYTPNAPHPGYRTCEKCSQEIDPRTKRARSVMTEVGLPCRRCGNDKPIGTYPWMHDVLIRFGEADSRNPHWLFHHAESGKTIVPNEDAATVAWGEQWHPGMTYGQKAHHLTLIATPGGKKKKGRAA